LSKSLDHVLALLSSRDSDVGLLEGILHRLFLVQFRQELSLQLFARLVDEVEHNRLWNQVSCRAFDNIKVGQKKEFYTALVLLGVISEAYGRTNDLGLHHFTFREIS
jgi:hypothetical protein